MTAIAGVIGRDDQPPDVPGVRVLLAGLAGLGPDGTGAWIGRVGRMGVAVGAARRRRTPEDDHDAQPVTLDGGVVVVGDVVLANRAELVTALGLDDGRAAALTDVDVVAHAYRRHGPALPPRLRGAFAIAIVDERRGGVLLVRDQIGRRPLLAHVSASRVAFASTALALTELDGVGHELDLERVRRVLALATVDHDSWVRGVESVERATAWWVTAQGVRRWRYWRPEQPDRLDDRPFAEQVDDLRTALDEATRSAIRGGERVGVMLSGGLDSTAVAATAARLVAPASVRTYTAVPPPGWDGPVARGWVADERTEVGALAQWYPNLRPTFVDGNGAAFLDEWDELFALGATPARNPCNWLIFRRLQLEASADGIDVLLDGGAGNLAFSADDPRWVTALVRRGHLTTAAREVVAHADVVGRSPRQVARSLLAAEVRSRQVRRRSGGHGFSSAESAARRWRFTALAPDQRTRAVADAVLAQAVDPAQRAWVASTTKLDRMFTTVAAQAELTAVMDARLGLRRVDPTCDLRVIELSLRQSPWVQRHDGWDRAAARAALSDRVPDSIRLRRTRGAQLPDWLERFTDCRDELTAEAEAAHDHPTSRALVDTERLIGALRAWPEPSQGADRETIGVHRLALPRGLLVAHYVRWFEERARSPRSVPADHGH